MTSCANKHRLLRSLAVAALLGVALTSCQKQIKPKVPQTDEQLLYEQGLNTLPNIPDIEAQVEQYRQELVVQNYLNQMMQSRAEAVTEADCQAFYDKTGDELRLDEPIVKGAVVRLLPNSSKCAQVRQWLHQLSLGNLEVLGEMDHYCSTRAASYDNFVDHWVRLSRLTDQLPVTVVDVKQFAKIDDYELKDADFVYLYVIMDYRLAGEKQPFEWSKTDIQELLIQQRRRQFKEKLVSELRAAAEQRYNRN